jgi:hypothetical protein
MHFPSKAEAEEVRNGGEPIDDFHHTLLTLVFPRRRQQDEPVRPSLAEKHWWVW